MTALLTKTRNNGKNQTNVLSVPNGRRKKEKELNKNLFNEEIKEGYLKEMIENETLSETSSDGYRRIFRQTYKMESLEEVNKDLFNFELEELENLLRKFNANNRNTIQSYARIISSYLNWAVDKGYTKKNLLADFRPDDFEKYLENEEEYFTHKTLLSYEEDCKNAQDAVILRLLFNGFGGKQMSELRNLKMTDVDKENMLVRLVNTLKEDKETGLPLEFTERWEKIDEYTLELIEDAFEEQTYLKKNGKINTDNSNNSSGRIREYTDLVSNDYVIRASITKTEDVNKPVDRYVIYRRIQMLSDYYGMKEKLNSKYIQRSGMIYYANQLIMDDELSLNSLKMVAKRFNLSSHHNLKGFLTVENIKKTYPENNLKIV